MSTKKTLKETVQATIDRHKSKLIETGHNIWLNPESSFQEKYACANLTKFLEEEGFVVEHNFTWETGFKAVFSDPGTAQCQRRGDTEAADITKDYINICLICEYDAVAGMGHAAAHNLSSEASLAAAVAIKECLKNDSLKGRVTVLGTPAEDNCGGTKVTMMNKGVFKDVDCVLMLAPYNSNLVSPRLATLMTVTVNYTGKAAHSSASPWDGRNALDAAITCYNNISILRQQLSVNWNVSGIIVHGGIQPNVIPDKTEMKFWLRAPEHTDLFILRQRAVSCFEAAAKATGCELEYVFGDTMYYPLQQNTLMGEIYRKHAEDMGVVFTTSPDKIINHIGSSDLGNVSQVVPCFCPAFDIGTDAPKNSTAFKEAADSEQAHENTLRAATALALTAVELISEPSLRQQMFSEYTKLRSVNGSLLQHKDVH